MLQFRKEKTIQIKVQELKKKKIRFIKREYISILLQVWKKQVSKQSIFIFRFKLLIIDLLLTSRRKIFFELNIKKNGSELFNL